MKRVGMKWKIFYYLMCFSAILLAILWVFQVLMLDSFYRYIKLSEVKKSGKEILSLINEERVLGDEIYRIAMETESYIEIINERGQSIVSVGDMKNRMPLEEKINLLQNMQGEEHIEYYDNFNIQDKKFDKMEPKFKGPTKSIIYLRKANDNNVIMINSMISPVDSTVKTLRYQLYVVTVIMIFFSIIFAIIIAKRLSIPIEKLNESAKGLAKGNYDVSFSDVSYKELGELSDTLNIATTELSKVENLRRELMANISHDLRTPLSLIYGYAEVMNDFPEDITPEQTQTIMDETQRLSSLVSDILNISNLEAGTQKLNITRFNLTESIRNTTKRMAELMKKDGYNIEFRVTEEVMIEGDEIKLTQAFYNLLINAINYTGKDKKVSVTQVIEDHKVIVKVQDTGEGIAKDDLPYIWDRYYKVDKVHKRAVTGTGLGLSIVKKIIDFHEGQCGAISEQGKGSEFWFELNIRQEF